MDEREMGGYEVTLLYASRRSGANMKNCIVEIRTKVTVM
jgi:hypothetical protein